MCSIKNEFSEVLIMAIFISIAKISRRSGSNSVFIGIPPKTSQDANKNPQGHGQSHLELDESTL